MNLSQPIAQVSSLQVPVPLPVHYTNCYVIDTQDGYVIVDTGMNTKAAKEAWEEFIQHSRLDHEPVRLLFVTHFHPDHLGLAQWLSERLDCPVTMMQGEAEFSATFRHPEQASSQHAQMHDFYRAHSVPDLIISNWLALDGAFRDTMTVPSAFEVVTNGETRTIGALDLTFVEQRGHTAHQGLIYLSQPNVLLTGDQVLPRITPNVSLWPSGPTNPLADYLSSLHQLLDLPHPIGLPAHEATIDDVNARVMEILAHHERRNQKLIEFLQDGPATAYDLTRRLFTRPLDDYQLQFAIGETLAHLEFLRVQQRIATRRSTGPIVYEIA
ncbi:MAG: hypothetical protein C7B45_14645 [Sulfobacillus acidophilus]|uniref:Metallo-beta-lactamase domain-containing protein n=1 Tax=Sulfobacillus acidophilus TaxID=53633 RepID=A0A2T2WE51_9FIRM|nr:MAG: hypothetical protein C7B45_14645 [Sulfobacillus acidophilus]